MYTAPEIVILAQEPCIREALSLALRSELPGLAYRFEGVDFNPPSGTKIIFLHEKGEAVPAFVMPQDAFEKPVRVGALLERLSKHGSGRQEDIVALFGPYELHTSDGTLVKKSGESVRLTEKENEILKLLYSADGKAIDKEQLLAQVWGYGAGIETHTLETHIYRLRQKIEGDASAPQILVTQDEGYALKR